MRDGLSVHNSPSEPSVSALVSKELKQLERQYSYEHTIQLGRYRKEPDEEASQEVIATAKKINEEAIESKKSVRFNEFDPREIWKEEKRARTWGAQIKRWKSHFAPSVSLTLIRMMIVDWLYLAALGIGMALLSMFMDNMIEYMQTFQMLLMTLSGRTGSVFLDYLCTYLSWLGYTELLVICSAMIT
uniref:Uncharacterized protein n=1 Tax=Panagrolaimus sp. JU765 TaxID=591449 RepID=A0AC34RAT3_9BILA